MLHRKHGEGRVSDENPRVGWTISCAQSSLEENGSWQEDFESAKSCVSASAFSVALHETGPHLLAAERFGHQLRFVPFDLEPKQRFVLVSLPRIARVPV